MGERRSDAREAALYVLERCRRFDAWSQQTLQSASERFSLDSRDAALCSRLCLTVLQNAALCDWYIGRYSSTPIQKLEPKVLDILRLGVCQILFLDKIPVSAAVDQAVMQTRRSSPRAAGLVNAVLRRIADEKGSLPPLPEEGTALELSIRFSHPLWLCKKLTDEHGYVFARAFLDASNREAGLTLSVNLCRTDRVTLTERLRNAGIPACESDYSAVSVEVPGSRRVDALPGFGEGEFFVQDAAAAQAILAASPVAGTRVLDACAAPGGKSFLCASLMGDRGQILACDLHGKKLLRLEDGAARLGFSSIRTAAMDAANPPEELFKGFDLVLADVPCSGLGVIRKKPEIRYKDPEELKKLPTVQRRILEGISACVRPGGKLVYSTCTILREENEAVTGAFLREHPAFQGEEERTIWPQEYGTDGFYYCIMVRDD